MYETVAASKTYKSEIAQLNKQIKDAEKAFEGQTQSINDNIDAINKKVAADVRAIQVARGYDTLNDSSKTQQAEILDLEIQKQQAVISGDIVATAFLQNQIDLKKDSLKLTQLQIEKINVETDSIKNLADVEIQNLKNQLEYLTKEFKVNINIKEAQDKLESLKAQSAAGGTVTSFNPKVAAEIQNATVPEIDEAAVKAKVEELYNKYQGIVSHGTISSALINIFQAGLKDTDEAGKLVDRFVNAAGQNNNQNIDFATKVTNLSDAYKRANSVLGDASGITENYDRIKEKGIALLNKETGENYKNFDSLTQIQQARVKYLGIMDLTKDRQDGFTKGLENGLLETAKLEAEQRRLAQTLGKIVTPEFESALKFMAKVVNEFSKFNKENPGVVKGFVGVGLAISSLVAVGGFLMPVVTLIKDLIPLFTGLSTSSGWLGATITALSGPIGWLIGAIVLLTGLIVYLWNTNEGFREAMINTWQNVVKWLLWAKDNFWEALGQVIGFFLTLPITITVALRKVQDAIWDWVSNIEWGKVWSSLLDGLKATLNLVTAYLSNFDIGKAFQGIGRGIMDFLKGLLKMYLGTFPGGDKMADEMVAKWPKYAKGANFIVPQGYENDTFPFMAQSGERVVVIPKDQVNNSEVNNNTEYHNYGLPTSSLSSNFGL
jgi:hypothetical protein